MAETRNDAYSMTFIQKKRKQQQKKPAAVAPILWVQPTAQIQKSKYKIKSLN